MLKLVCFVYLVHLVYLVEPNKRDKPNNGLLLLADFFSILLKREVEASRQAMAKGIKLGQWKLRRTARAVNRHSSVNCMIPPDAISDVEPHVLGKHEPSTHVSIRSNTETQHRDTGSLL